MKIIVGILLIFSFKSEAQRANIILEQTFDKTVGKWFENNMQKPYSATIVCSPKRPGGALRVELRKADNYRAEFGTNPNLAKREIWVGYSLFFPECFVKDASEECIQQFQAYPDLSEGEEWRSPPLMLAVLNDRFVIEIRTDTNRITQKGKSTFERIDLGQVQKDKWLDFVFHIKWSYRNDGVVQLWRNDSLIYNGIGKPNCYNDRLYPYFKIGIYKWDWSGQSNSTTNSRTLYVDEVRLGNEKATYNDVRHL